MTFGKVGSSGMVFFYTMVSPFKGVFGPKTYETRIIVGNKKAKKKGV